MTQCNAAEISQLTPFTWGSEADTFKANQLNEAPMLDKSPRPAAVNVPHDLAAHWMPFTAHRAFKKQTRLLDGSKHMN